MRDRKSYVMVLFMAIVLLTGCKTDYKPHHLAACGSYAVPGMDCFDLKGSSYTCVVLEEDSYGRVLYTYMTHDVVSGKEENALIICQLLDGEFVYFYEDVCFKIGEYDEADIEQIKAQNDWEKKQNFDKMTRREVVISMDSCLIMRSELDYRTVKEECCEVLEIDKTEIEEFCICYNSEKGYELYFLELQTEEEQQKYWVICDLKYNIYMAPVDEDLNNIEALIELKKESGWY